MASPGQARRTQQPSQFVPVNSADPLYQGAAVLYPGRQTARAMGGAGLLLGRDGLGYTTSNTSDWWMASPTALASLNATWTIMAFVNGASGNSSSPIFYCERPNDTQIVKLGFESGNHAQLVVRDLSSNLIILTGSATVKADTGRRAITAVRRASNDHRLYVNGSLDGTATGNINGAFGAAIAVLGNDPQDTASTLNGASLPLVIVWPRALSDAEIVRASREAVYGALQPQPRRAWLAYATSVTNTVITPSAASVQVAGFAPSVTQGVTTSISPAPASVQMTGYAPVMVQSQNTSFAPGPASVQVAGYAPSISQTLSRNLTPDPAFVSVVGYPPTINRGASLTFTPTPAALQVTGYAPTIGTMNNLKGTIQYRYMRRSNLELVRYG